MTRLLSACVVLFTALTVASAKDRELPLYELRTYTANAGKLPALNTLVKDHALKGMAKHGITPIGVWVPTKADAEKLYLLVAHTDRVNRDANYKAFQTDAAWKAAAAEASKDGKVVKTIDEQFLHTTDYSKPVKAEAGSGDRVFELRTYTCTQGNLDALNARFRDHTVKLFEKYGMTNLYYFTLAKGEKNDDVMMMYFLAHKSEAAAKASFDGFRKDGEWVKARDDSEKKAGGTLTEPKGGVVSVFLKATDYSPTK